MNSEVTKRLSVIDEEPILEELEEMYRMPRSSMIRGISHKQLIIYQDYDDEEESNVEKLFEGIDQNINLKDEDGKAPICKAIEENDLKLVKYLIERGAYLSHINPKDQTAFALAQELGKTDIIEHLEKIPQEETKDTIEALGQELKASTITDV